MARPFSELLFVLLKINLPLERKAIKSSTSAYWQQGSTGLDLNHDIRQCGQDAPKGDIPKYAHTASPDYLLYS